MAAVVRPGFILALAAGALGLLLALAGAGSAVAQTGLVAAYGFDEPSGPTAADVSGNGNTGTLSGPTRSAAGRFGAALSFDGTNDAVVVPDSASLDLTSGMTVEAWVRPTALGTKWRTVLAKENGARLAYGLYANRNTSVPFAEVYVGGATRGTPGAAQLPLSQWSHLATTYDGATLKLFVNGSLVGSASSPGAIAISAGQLRIGGNSIWGEWFQGLIDEVRIYSRALAADEISRDMATSVATPDTTAPSAPAGLVVTQATATSLSAAWQASSDDVGVSGYAAYLDGVQVASTAALGYVFGGLACSTSHELGVEARDAAGNISARTTMVASTTACDNTPPSVTLTTPPGGTVSGNVTVAADATDVGGIAGVQFTLDGAPLGAEDTEAPYSLAWNTRSAAPGAHSLGAVARDPSGNSATAAVVQVEVNNGTAPPPGLVAAYALEDGTGTTVSDSSGKGNIGTLSGPSWTTAGRFRSALSFDGVNDRVNVADSASLKVTAVTLEAAVRPTALGSGWRTVAGKERSGGIVYVLYANRNTGVPAAQVYAGGLVRTVNGPTALPLNVWSHLAATYDGTTLRLYVGGALVASAPGGGPIATSTGQLRVGGNGIWGEYFAGLIDEVRVYDRALSEPELRADMDSPIPSAPLVPTLTLAETEDDEFVSARTVYYRPRAGGDGRFSVTATTGDAGGGIDRVAFPDVFGGDALDDRTPPYSADYAWAGAATSSGAKTVSAVNVGGLASSSTFTVTPDTAVPTGGSVTYVDGYDADGSVAVTTANGSDGLSGVNAASVRRERQTAPLAGGACGEYGPWEAAGNPDALATARCARYRLRVADNVGNEAVNSSARVARVDLTAPLVALQPPSELAGADALYYDAAARMQYFRSTGAGSFALAALLADPESGPGALFFPDLSGVTGWSGAGGANSVYSWTPGATAPGSRTVRGTNGAGLSTTADVAIVADADPPAGGSVTYTNGYDADGVVLVVTDAGSDPLSGLDPTSALLERQTAVLAGGACGEPGPWEPAASPDHVASGGCVRYRLRVSDRVGNEVSYEGSGFAKVDLTPPAVTAGTPQELSGGESQIFDVAAGVHYFRPAAQGSFRLEASVTDAESSAGAIAFPDLSELAGWTGDGGVDPVYAWTPGAASPGARTIVGSNAAGLSAEAQASVVADPDPPAGGSVSYPDGYDDDGVVLAASDPGADALSGLASETAVLEHQTAPLTTDCGDFGAWEPASYPDRFASGTCAKYRLRVADNVGNEAVFDSTAVVRVAPPPTVDETPPAAPLLTVTESEPDQDVQGSTLYYGPLADLGDSEGSFEVSAETTDPESGVAFVRFPSVFADDGVADAETPYATTYSWDSLASVSGDFSVVSVNNDGLENTSAFTVVRDVDGPQGGFVAYVDGYDDGQVTVEVSAGVDAGVGIDTTSPVLERQTALLQGNGSCADFGGFAATPITNVVAEGTCAKYRYRVWDKVGNRTTYRSGREVKVDTIAPTSPTGLAASETGPTGTSLAWGPATDALGVLGYGVYRDGVRIANTSAHHYRIGWLGCETAYRFSIDALDAAGNRSDPVDVYVTTASCPPASGGADLYLSPSGSDAAPCTQADPCLTFDRAYEVAEPGQIVEIAGGRYGFETIEEESKTSVEPIVFRVAEGAAVVVDEIDVEASHVVVRGVQTAYTLSAGGESVQGVAAIGRGSEGVVLEDVDAGYFFIAGDEARILGGDYGPTVDEVSKISPSGSENNVAPRDIVIDGAVFHDFVREEDHMECLNVAGANGLVVRNSRFNNCAVFGIFFKAFGAEQTMRNVTIENNFFANTMAMDMSAMIKLTTNESQVPCTDVLIRNNTVVDKLVLSDCPGTNVRWESNILESLPESVCEDRPTGTTFDFNVIEQGAACGANDVLVADALLVNREAFDLHLLPGSPAIDRASPASSAHDDIDGDLRPQGGAADAGADEFVFSP